MFDLEPSLVWVTITGELTEVALMGVYLVILGLEDDLDRLDLEPLEPPLEPPPPRPLVSDNSTIVTRTTATRSTVAIRILAEVPTTTILIQFSPFVALPSQCL